MARVVVTGLGVVSPIGVGRHDFWSSLAAGRSGEGPITAFDASAFPVRVAAEVREWDELRRHWPGPVPNELAGERRTRFLLAAAGLCLADAELVVGGPACRRAMLAVGAGLGVVCLDDVAGFLDSEGGFDGRRFASGLSRVRQESMLRNGPDLTTGLLASCLGSTGPSLTVTSACAAGAQAIGLAYRWLREGRGPVALAGASDSMINPLGVAGFALVGAASRHNVAGATSRPFDRTRSGMVLGEGAALVTLETLEHAVGRGAPIYAEVVGYASTLDAYRMTDPHPAGDGAVRAMAGALRDAALPADAVDHVNAHGTATPINDRIETLAIKRVLGAHSARTTVTANKSMTGHLVAACGALEFAATVLTIHRQFVPPTINRHHPDPECDLDCVPHVGRAARVGVAITNSFGLGGQNACLVVARPDEARRRAA